MTSIIDLDLKWKDFANLCTLIISMRKWKLCIFYLNKSKEFFDILVLVQRGDDGSGGTRLNESSNVQGGPTRCTTTS
jgi:hypothetical protein